MNRDVTTIDRGIAFTISDNMARPPSSASIEPSLQAHPRSSAYLAVGVAESIGRRGAFPIQRDDELIIQSANDFAVGRAAFGIAPGGSAPVHNQNYD